MRLHDNRMQKDRGATGRLCLHHLSIPTCSFKYLKQATLKDGIVLHIRPVRWTDAPGLTELYSALSDHSVFYRFGLRRINMPYDRLVRLCQIDYERDFAFLAVSPGKNERIVGEARVNGLAASKTAELSFVVADNWQGRGVGRLLMDHCLTVAREIGLTALLMEVMKSNVPMLQLGFKYDFQLLSSNREDDTETLELRLDRGIGVCQPTRWDASLREEEIHLSTGTHG